MARIYWRIRTLKHWLSGSWRCVARPVDGRLGQFGGADSPQVSLGRRG